MDPSRVGFRCSTKPWSSKWTGMPIQWRTRCLLQISSKRGHLYIYIYIYICILKWNTLLSLFKFIDSWIGCVDSIWSSLIGFRPSSTVPDLCRSIAGADAKGRPGRDRFGRLGHGLRGVHWAEDCGPAETVSFMDWKASYSIFSVIIIADHRVLFFFPLCLLLWTKDGRLLLWSTVLLWSTRWLRRSFTLNWSSKQWPCEMPDPKKTGN